MRFDLVRAARTRLGAFVISGTLLAALALGANALISQPVAAEENDDGPSVVGSARFGFDGFCGVSLADDVLTISGGGITVPVNIANAHGNLHAGGPQAAGTVTGTPTGSLSSRLVAHLLQVRGFVVDGEYLASVVNVTNSDCSGTHLTRTPGPTRTPHETHEPRLTNTPRPTHTPHPTHTPRTHD